MNFIAALVAFAIRTAIIYYVVPIATTYQPSAMQAAAITFLLIMLRMWLTEDVTVKLDAEQAEIVYEREDE